MESYLRSIISLLLVAVVPIHASLHYEVYWDKMLRNTQMPERIRELLPTDLEDKKSTFVNVGKGGVVVDHWKPRSSGTHVNVGKGAVGVNTGKPGGKGTPVSVGAKGGINVNNKHAGDTRVEVGGGRGGVHVGAEKPGGRTNVGVGKGGVEVHTSQKGKPVIFLVHPGPNPLGYNYAASELQLYDDPYVALFSFKKTCIEEQI